MLAGLAFAGLDDIHQMNAMKVLLQTSINGVAALIFLFSDDLVWRFALPMAAMSAIGGFLGIAVARKMPQDVLRGDPRDRDRRDGVVLRKELLTCGRTAPPLSITRHSLS